MKFHKMLKTQLHIMIQKLDFQISFSVMMLYALGVYILNVRANLNMDVLSTRSASDLFALVGMGEYYSYIINLFPFLVLFPYSFSYMNDKKTRMGMLLQSRMGNRHYYLSQITACFLGGMVLFLIPLLVNLILTHVTFLETGYTYYGYYGDFGYCSMLLGTNAAIRTVNSGMSFLGIYLKSPILYEALYSLFFSLFAGLIGVFGLACSYYIKKHKITLFIITYLLFLISNILDGVSYSSSIYLNTKLLDYVSVNAFKGKSTLYFLGVCTVLFVFSIFSVRRMGKRDQI